MIPPALLLLSLPQATPAAPLLEDAPIGRLLFTRQLGGRDDLFALHLPEGRLQRLTDHAAKDSHGVPSPDGGDIAFCSERKGWWKVWRMKADGSGIVQVTRPSSGADYHPCWSPDGTRLAYVSGSQGNGDILTCDLDGKTSVNLTRHAARDNFPAWSPDGKAIAFASDRSGTWGLFLMGPDGADVRALAVEGEALEPAWFPDGRRLAYQASEDGETFDLWTLSIVDGRREGPATRLTEGPASDERPTISPDGRWIAFESDRAGGSQLYLMPSTGGEPRQLTREGYCYGPAWIPSEGR